MSRVETGSRLHFGLFNLGSGPRRFGGVGLMVEEPAVVVSVQPAREWSASGPLAERALAFAQRLSSEPMALVVEKAGPAHAGLGCGTQLALAVGRAVCPKLTPLELASRLGRGQRSAVGIHGFAQGGFLVEAGKQGDEISPLLERVDFPPEWRILLAIPSWAEGLHGHAERRAFEEISPSTPSDYLQRLAMQVMLPAVAGRDLDTFGEALFEFNRRVGEAFAAVQGGPYASQRLAELVDFIRGHGVRGVGQSSWGPAIFAVATQDRAESLCASIRRRFNLPEAEAFITSARNRGAGSS
jgi:beta-RFAP synthase